MVSEKGSHKAAISNPPLYEYSKEISVPDEMTTMPTTAVARCFSKDNIQPCRANSLSLTGGHGLSISYIAHSGHPKQLYDGVSSPCGNVAGQPAEDDISTGQENGPFGGITSYDGQSEDCQPSKAMQSDSKDSRHTPNRGQPTIIPTLDHRVESPSSQPSEAYPLSHEDFATIPRALSIEERVMINAPEADNNTTPQTDDLLEDKPFYKRHRRNLAALQIGSTNINSIATNNRADLDGGTPILSPEPISPLRQLRVRRSIPQLLNALPGSSYEDGEAQDVARDAAAVVSTEWQRDRHAVEEPGSNARSEEQPWISSDAQSSPNVLPHSRSGLQKFKLKVRKSESQEPRSGLSMPNEVDSDSNHTSIRVGSPERKKLQIKRNRSQWDFHNDIGLRSTSLKPANSLANFRQSPLKGSRLASEMVLESPLTPNTSESMASTPRSFSASNTGLFAVRRNRSFKLSTPRPGMKNYESIFVASKVQEDMPADAAEKEGLTPRRGIRQRISMSRLLHKNKRRAKLSKRRLSVNQSVSSDTLEVTTSGRHDSHRASMTNIPSRTTVSSIKPGGREGRFKRFTRNAKRLIKRCVRRKLDHPSAPKD